jgi:hypothetical protein
MQRLPLSTPTTMEGRGMAGILTAIVEVAHH